MIPKRSRTKQICFILSTLLLVSTFPFSCLATNLTNYPEFHNETSLIIDGIEYDASTNLSGDSWSYFYYGEGYTHELILSNYHGGSIYTNADLAVSFYGKNSVDGSTYGFYSSNDLQVSSQTRNEETGYLTVSGSDGYEAIYSKGTIIVGGDLTASGGNRSAIYAEEELNLYIDWPSTVKVGMTAQDAVDGEYSGQNYVSFTRIPLTLTLYANGGHTESGESFYQITYSAYPMTRNLFKYTSVFINGESKLLGWSENPDGTGQIYAVDDDFEFSENTYSSSLYAIWEDATNKAISLKNYYGKCGEMPIYQHCGDTVTRMVKKDQEYTLPDQEKSGCTFDGWLSEDGMTLYPAGTKIVVSDSMTFTAVFSPKILIVDGKEYDASESWGSYSLGWHYSATQCGTSDKTYSSQLNIYKNYSGGSISIPGSAMIYIYGNVVGSDGIPAINVDGDVYIFVSILKNKTEIPVHLYGGSYAPAIRSTGEIRVFVCEENTKLILKGGSEKPAIEAASIVSENRAFWAGENENSMCLVSNYSQEHYVEFVDTSDITFTTKFDYNGHGIDPIYYYDVPVGTTISPPEDPSESGYTFLGWYKEPECITRWDFDSDLVMKDTTLYAKWRKNSSHSSGGSTSGFEASIAPSKNGTISLDRSYASKGNTVTVTATPNDGYTVDAVTVKDAQGSTVTTTKQSDGVYTFTMPGSKVTISATFKAEESSPVILPTNPSHFTDVKESDWFYDSVGRVYEKGLMKGVSDTEFAPYNGTTRAMVVTMLWRLAGSPVVNYALPFTDVPENEWYTEAVRWATSTGIVNGVTGTKFAPNNLVTREELATMIYRYEQSLGNGFVGSWVFLLPQNDRASVSGWADEAMHWCVMKKIINRDDKNNLNPQKTATRAEVATIFMNLVQAF